ncbi:MAG TPA: class I SAM-dependent methyltransferase [Ramlibacter sp.]|uniref:SAM-dependent methyltransferase n=1 Tax=Ramlibacter sp. TaxID=1917967 RepID=UPI002B6154EE|nr:class I SAM-dependent methyltransferase [Ramlibacter sp.]HVZ46676.1 class I SAM-dependent methyltransferase [Ramlibacter sp.]
MSILLTMLRNMRGSLSKPAAQAPTAETLPHPQPPSEPPAPTAATIAGSPREPSPDRIYSLDTTPPIDYEPGFDIDYASATLTDIADHYKTDKGSIKHRYTLVYEQYFEGMRGAPIDLMEIGVACGSSLKTWAKYFSRSRVVGVDIRDACKSLCKGWPQIEIMIADATALDTQRMFDVIIDDGSHVSLDIVQAFAHLWPRVKPGGYYVIEDLRCTHDAHYQRMFTFPKDPAAFDRSHFAQFADAALRDMDNGEGDIDFMHFWRQMCFVRKRG